MIYRKIESNTGAKCVYDFECIRYPKGRINGRRTYTINKGEFALYSNDHWVCSDCIVKYINQQFVNLIEVSKQIIAEGNAEMTEAIIFNLGEVEEILKEKK